ncbi:MAG TPA: hypothetical protein VJO35_05095 [Terriglobales bacterium]|nr:hypothetical protein [Terriglobales bacterium]
MLPKSTVSALPKCDSAAHRYIFFAQRCNVTEAPHIRFADDEESVRITLAMMPKSKRDYGRHGRRSSRLHRAQQI